MGLFNARIAGEIAALALRRGSLMGLRCYESNFQKLYGAHFRFMGLLRRALNMLSDDLLEKAFKKMPSNSWEVTLDGDLELDRQLKLVYEAVKNKSWLKVILCLIFSLTSS